MLLSISGRARQISAGRRRHDSHGGRRLGSGLHPSNFFLSAVCAASVIAGAASAALADYRIRNDYGGFIHKYKLKYAAIRDRGIERHHFVRAGSTFAAA